ncbi:MAG: eukaryotic-like serine/threonine-protein kinase [Solirubrobacteraceae bacterium]|jgi:serine/threonine protein kinase|nr:eukaryotic-like serine/threonine-protein kinase [Solirubrobacteraceae bacterium]
MTTDQLFADRYRLDRRLGVGGMSTVRLAFDTRLERNVAVKLLAEHLAEDPSFVSRFRREALSAARLVHPNIVQVFDFGSDRDSGRQFIVMEYVDGQSCAEILRDRGHLEPAEAVDILAQSCRGLDYAHRNGVVHRDVKPGNLLLSDDGMIKLADFGIAKAAEQSDITKVGSVLGTAAYLSPEQARGEPAGPPSDLYALGVVAYQLMAGRLPYQATSLTELARQQSTPPPRIDDLVDDVPPALAAAVQRALAGDPDQRYADAGAMEQALREGLSGRGPTSVTETAWLDPDDSTDATQALSRTSATSALPPRRRRLEPIDEPAPAPMPVAPPRAARSRARSAPPPREVTRGGGPGKWIALLLVIALIVAGVAAYQAVGGAGKQAVQLRQQVQGKANDAINQLRGLINDNTQ